MILTRKILGTPLKRIGDVVFAEWNGLTVGRTYNPSPSNPQTERQQSNRNKFAVLNAIAKKMSPATSIGLKRAFQFMTHRNAFVKIASASDFVGDNGNGWEVADPDILEISRGSLSVPQNIGATYDAANNELTVSWQDTGRNGNDRSDDQVCVAVAKESFEEVAHFMRVGQRADQQAILVLPFTPATGEMINIYLFFNSEVGTKCSPTGYHVKMV